MVVTQIRGRSLNKSKEIDSNVRADILKEVGRQLAIINSIKVGGFGDIVSVNKGIIKTINPDYGWSDLSKKVYDRLLFLEKKEIITYKHLDKVYRYLEMGSVIFHSQKEYYLNHGDLSASHIYIDGGKYSGLIDLGDARGGFRYSDLAHIYIFDNNIFGDVLNGYSEHVNISGDFTDEIKILGVLIVVNKLYWRFFNRPEKVNDKSIFKFLENIH